MSWPSRAPLPLHPRTGDSALGFRRDGRPIWPIKGSSGEGVDPSAEGGTPPAVTPAPEAGGASTPLAPDPAAAQQLADVTQRADEAAAERDQLRAALDAVNEALNPNAEQSGQDPAALAASVADRDKQLGQAAADLRAAQVELAAYKVAAAQGARADRLLNSRSFANTLAALHPGDGKFDEQLAAAIKTAVDADPDLYRPAVQPARGGAEFNGAPAGERRAATLHDAVAARMSGA
ncbi:hypothetical protein ACFWZT_00800 [Streptomyces alboflavus]|uniref:hypothetical protein n=1 Tax=Streptomyces alboflavus TaxID=67267 RepID=UPI003675C314